MNVGIFAGGLSWPMYVAADEGMFSQSGLDVRIAEVADSVSQMRDLLSGEHDVVMTPFDNVVAYQERQGEVELDAAPDFFAFMGGVGGSLRLLSGPAIETFADLEGATIGVDAERTGYTLAMYKLLDDHGVPQGAYTLKKIGGTTYRVKALADETIAATMVSSPQEIVPERRGFRRLGDVTTMIGPYQAVCGAARRSWASRSGAELRAFIAAYVRAARWLEDPAHLDAAVGVFRRHVPSASDELARSAWHLMIGGAEGFQPRAAFDPEGGRTVLRIRSQFGRPPKTLTDWSVYVDESYYRDAIASS